VIVSAVDPHDEGAFDEWFHVLDVTDQERWPGLPGWQRVERLAMALDEDGPVVHRAVVARSGAGAGAPGAAAGQVCGIGELQLPRRENLDLAEVDVRVLPAFRRMGVGRAIVAALEEIAVVAGRTELTGSDEVPVRPGYLDAAQPFARDLGFSAVQQNVRRELQLPLDPDRVRALREAPKARPVGYTLLTFTDRWPDALVADRCELGRRMSTDVPMGDQVLDEEVWDEQRVRQLEAAMAAQNRAKVITAARHDESGRVVGFTELAVPLGAPESVWQHDTLVLREHRGHSLGFAMKVANVLELAERYPAVRRVNTWNAAENEHMIATNEAMGFEVTALSTTWRKSLRG
jgi:GNAT superfamily N-acetyltransferase